MASAYADFMISDPISDIGAGMSDVTGDVPHEVAVPVVNNATPRRGDHQGAVILNQSKFSILQGALEEIGITGITVTNVMGYGMQKGHTQMYRGVPLEAKLLPKLQVDIVICKVPVDLLVETVRKALYTGNVGDGKIFLYDVNNVVKIRTGEEGYSALQDE